MWIVICNSACEGMRDLTMGWTSSFLQSPFLLNLGLEVLQAATKESVALRVIPFDLLHGCVYQKLLKHHKIQQEMIHYEEAKENDEEEKKREIKLV